MSGQAHTMGIGLGMAPAAYDNATKPQPHPKKEEEADNTALLAGGIGALCGALLDIIEAATNLHHRQFPHSVAFVALAFKCPHRVHCWQPKGDLHRASLAGTNFNSRWCLPYTPGNGFDDTDVTSIGWTPVT